MSMQEAQADWTPPATIEEAETMRLQLVEKLNDIESQLSARKKGDPACYVESSASFYDWRRRAVFAKKFVIADLRRLNLWIKQRRREMTADRAKSLGVDPKSPKSMLLAAANVFQRLRGDGVEMDQEEIDVFDAIRGYLVETAGESSQKRDGEGRAG